jgi:hypothetical protein
MSSTADAVARSSTAICDARACRSAFVTASWATR